MLQALGYSYQGGEWLLTYRSRERLESADVAATPLSLMAKANAMHGALMRRADELQHMTELKRLRDHAMMDGKLGAAVRAEYLRGKAAGLYDRLEHSAVNEFARMSDEELRQGIVDQAQALEALGIDLSPVPKANAKKH
jgi:hypothetical protein